MRALTVLPLFLLAAGCLAPGERDPTRYPWDAGAQPIPETGEQQRPGLEGSYCIMSLEMPGTSGIVANPDAQRGAVQLACNPPPLRQRK
jgi:hypothetical protein